MHNSPKFDSEKAAKNLNQNPMLSPLVSALSGQV